MDKIKTLRRRYKNLDEWATVALAAHRDYAGIDGDDDIQVWHLLLSLLVFCEINGIDFNENLADARQHLAEHGS